MNTVIDVTQTAQEMVRLSQEVTESGLLEQVRDIVAAVDTLGSQIGEHRTLMQAAARDASDLHAYVTQLEHLFRRLAA